MGASCLSQFRILWSFFNNVHRAVVMQDHTRERCSSRSKRAGVMIEPGFAGLCRTSFRPPCSQLQCVNTFVHCNPLVTRAVTTNQNSCAARRPRDIPDPGDVRPRRSAAGAILRRRSGVRTPRAAARRPGTPVPPRPGTPGRGPPSTTGGPPGPRVRCRSGARGGSTGFLLLLLVPGTDAPRGCRLHRKMRAGRTIRWISPPQVRQLF